MRLGAPEYGGDTVGPLTLERIRYAARLHRRTKLPILVSGGRIKDRNATLAAAMKEALVRDFQVPVAWTEDRSRSTFENAQFSSSLLLNQGVRSVYLVTHAWHMPRAAAAFAAAGLRVEQAATAYTSVGAYPAFEDFLPRAQALTESAHASHEAVGRIWYRLAYE